MPDDWEQLIGYIFTVTMAVAGGAWYAALQTKRAADAKLLATFLKEYAESAMHDALRDLREWAKDNPDKSQWELARIFNALDSPTLDSSRRLVRSYFDRAARLHEQKFASDRFLTEIGYLWGIKILFEIIEPLEQIQEANRDGRTFECFRPYYENLRGSPLL